MPATEIQFASAARLGALRQIAEDLGRKARDRAHEARDLAANLAQARQRLADLRGSLKGYSITPPDHRMVGREIAARSGDQGDPVPEARTLSPDRLAAETAALQARIADLETALETARFEADDASARWTAAQRLFENCLDYAKDADLPLPPAVHQVGPDRYAGQAVHAEVRS